MLMCPFFRLSFSGESSGCSAGENQAALCYGQTDFICFHGAAGLRIQYRMQQISKNSRLQTGRIGIDQEEERFFG